MSVQTRPAWLTLRAVIGVLVGLLAILGAAGVLPFTAVWVFALIAALAIATFVPL